MAAAEEVGCVTTAWKLLGANHRVCVSAFDDPKVPGVACHISQARTGGIKGLAGRGGRPFAVFHRLPPDRPDYPAGRPAQRRTVFSEGTSLIFKETRVNRLWDPKRRTLVYLAISRKVIEGAPANSISSVPVMPWR